MFNWNVEDMKLLTMARVGEGYDKAFACESEVSIEDKFEFVDRMQDGKLTYFYDMVKNFGEAIPSMKKDGNGKPTDYAKKAWVRKNDSKELFCRTTDSYNNYGDFNLLGCRLNLFTYHSCFETKRKFKEIFINKLFHSQLKKCEDMEHDHFYDQNETVQLLYKLKDKYRVHCIWLFEACFKLEVKVAQNPSQKNNVVVTTFSAGYTTDYKDKELSIEEIQQLDAELTKLDDLKVRIKQAEQDYEDARKTLAMLIESMGAE